MVISRLLLALLFCWVSIAQAAPEFPKLKGRVVDGASYLSAAAERRLSQQLQAHEQAGGNQVVVATFEDLQGYSIEEFGYQLGREWGIGQKGKDNGVLLLVAKAERKVRIEVGYGLEGTLTDAISANIIQSVILPTFKQRQFERGIAGALLPLLMLWVVSM
ncbi:TPM domain-containing protein [Oceanicoccus sagamiensis]|uniref:TPM domain-containing protein n=1 Tax=Oceanicoccus sagamiensis TaxID=716816 RepID=UPI001F0A6870|nr:TPM domain-containing protein [Oceanicoccus sagamiensis]